MDTIDTFSEDYNLITRKSIDWPIFIIIILSLITIYLLNQFEVVKYPWIPTIITIGLIISPFISRKMIYGIIYYLKFMQFYKLLYSKINTKEDFKKAFLYYSWFCSAENLKKMNTGIYVGFHILNLHFNNLLNSTQINITPSKEEDFSHRDYMTVIPFICLACDLVSSYNRKQHQDIGKNLEKDLGDIQLEKVYYRIVRDCFIDGGEGFLSTLELMLLIMIHLRTPEEKRKLVREFLEDIYDDKIGWLNRKLFETIIVIAMMDNNSEKILDSLKIKIEKEGIKNGKDKYSDNHKYNLRNGLLKQIVSGYGIKYAD